MRTLTALICLVLIAAIPAQASESGYKFLPQPTPDAAKAEPPPSPKLSSPEAYTVINEQSVTLKWEAVAESDFYTVQVATDPNFRWMSKNESMFKGTEITVNVEPGRHYFWRVASNKANNQPGTMKSYFATSTFETPGDYKGPGPN
ncbi:MAG: fibronectin type III domain-containing protein [Pseudobdellovibrionaceae bacterium]